MKLTFRLLLPVAASLLAGTAVVAPIAPAAAQAATRAVPLATAITPNGSWPVYHHDDGHTGYDSTQPKALTASAGWVSLALDQTIYAEPLVYQGIVYAATLNNTVYALNQTDGTVVWSKHLRTPQSGGWQCGNVSPQGIIGTPAIDPTTGRIYVVTLSGTDQLYRLEGLDLATGNESLTTVITTKASTGFDWTIQQERGALAVRNGYVYVPFGGRAGDCGPYHGWIFAVPSSGTGSVLHYVTPGQGAGFWTAGGVVVDDATGKVFETSGNGTSSGCDANSNGTAVFENDAVVRLSATLAHEDAFYPQDWQANWCGNDQDLGSASMVLISSTLAFQAGKWGTGFLVNPQALGGMDGQLYPTPQPAAYSEADVCLGNHSDANFGSYAYAAPFVYLSCEGNGLVALHVDTATPSSFSPCDSVCGGPSWNASGFSPGPPIVAGGAVWAVDTGGAGLYGFDAATGAQIYHSAGFGVTHFSTPSEAGGQIFVGSDNVVRSFRMTTGCQSVAVGAAPPSPQIVGTAVTITGTASGCPNPSPLYEFMVFAPGATAWNIVQPYGASPTYNWSTANQPAGTYRFSVWVHDASSPGAYSNSLGSYDAFNAGQFYTLTSQTCATVGVSAAPPGPAQVGVPVTLTGAATGCPNPLYEFMVLAPGAGAWTIVRPYSSTPSFNWSTTGLPAGTYRFSVWVRDTSSTGAFTNSIGSYDAFNAGQFFTLTPGCAAVSVSAAPPSPAMVGTSVTITGAASGCLNANPLYEFMVLAPGAGAWTIVQPYSPTPTLSWSTTGKPAGTYRFSVWVHDAGNTGVYGNSIGSYDAFNAGQFFTLTPGCAAVSVSASPASPKASGTPVTITASASGCLNPNPLYEFMVLTPGASAWTIVRTYSTTATFNWSTLGLPPGTYRFSVWVHDSSNSGVYTNSIGSYDAFNAGLFYTLS